MSVNFGPETERSFLNYLWHLSAELTRWTGGGGGVTSNKLESLNQQGHGKSKNYLFILNVKNINEYKQAKAKYQLVFKMFL